jgi:hypothetical protein
MAFSVDQAARVAQSVWRANATKAGGDGWAGMGLHRPDEPELPR